MALTRPLEEQRPAVTFDDDALARVVEESQQYPYFLQLWGAALWTAARSSRATRIGASQVDMAAPEFDRSKSAYYEDRREELERHALLDMAVIVADAFSEQVRLRSSELNEVVAGALSEDDEIARVLDWRDRLAAVGFVWKPPAEDAWQPGIPSLMDYVAACEDSD